MRRASTQAALLAAAVLALYANTLDNGFHFDDEHSIVDNQPLRDLANAPAFFVDAGLFSADPDVAMYRPFLLVSYGLNFALGGEGPAGFHLVNAGLHAAFAALVLAAARCLGAGPAAAGWAALWVAVHPVNSQAVNYVSSRSEVLAALGVLAAFVGAALVRRPRPLAAAAGHLAGILSKSTAIVAAPLVALYELGRRDRPRRWLPTACLAATSAVWLGLATASGFLSASLGDPVRPLGTQLLTQAKALAYYPYLLAAPAHLSIAHPFAEAEGAGPAVVAAALLTLSAAGGCLWAWWRGKAAGFGGVWFYAGLGLTTLMPLHVLVSEQRLYLSTAGLAFGAAAAFGRRGLGRVAPAVLCALLAALTWQRNGVWRDELSLWTDAARWAADSERVHANLGEAYYERGDTARARQEYERALELDPASPDNLNNLGVLRDFLGQPRAAEAAYRAALAARPDWPEAQQNLGRLLLNLGRTEEAEALLARAAQRKPSATGLVNLGVAATRRGDRAAAQALFARALQLQPGRVDARVNLASLRMEEAVAAPEGPARRQRLAEAAALYEEILRDVADHPAALVNLAGARRALGDEAAARQLYERAVARHPGSVEAHAGYGSFLLAGGQVEAAATHLQTAVALGQRDGSTWQDLGKAQALSGRFGAAAEAFREACRVWPDRPEPLYNLGEVLAALGEEAAAGGDGAAAQAAWAEARAAYEAVAALAPGYRAAPQRLALLRQRVGGRSR